MHGISALGLRSSLRTRPPAAPRERCDLSACSHRPRLRRYPARSASSLNIRGGVCSCNPGPSPRVAPSANEQHQYLPAGGGCGSPQRGTSCFRDSSAYAIGVAGGRPSCGGCSRRGFSTIASLAQAQEYGRFYDGAFMPRSLRKVKVFHGHPPDNLAEYFGGKLNFAHSNPRSIIKLYKRYMRLDDHPDYGWLVRCFCQLGNVFGFNSFWAPQDKQVIHSLPSFKFLVHDLVERKHLLEASAVPRLLYAMAALEYRSQHLLPTLLEHVDVNLGSWRPATAANMALCLALLGIGDNSGNNSFGPADNLSRDYSGLIERLTKHVHAAYANPVPDAVAAAPPLLRNYLDEVGCTPFDKAGLAFALTICNLYDVVGEEDGEPTIALLLRKACENLTVEQLQHSGWVQFMLYLCLYCADAEAPKASTAIKKSVPFEHQQDLHLRWLDNILVNGQAQGREWLQTDVDASLKRLHVEGSLINCSVGREWDEQHCFFAGHLIKPLNLALEYDYLMPLGPGRPKPSGLIALKERLFSQFGLNVAIIHRSLWDTLSMEQKDVQLMRLLAQFPQVIAPDVTPPPSYKEDENLRLMKHKRQKFETWPPERIEV